MKAKYHIANCVGTGITGNPVFHPLCGRMGKRMPPILTMEGWDVTCYECIKIASAMKDSWRPGNPSSGG